jgi:hypothetical protein
VDETASQSFRLWVIDDDIFLREGTRMIHYNLGWALGMSGDVFAEGHSPYLGLCSDVR